jgi:hypothetical protein
MTLTYNILLLCPLSSVWADCKMHISEYVAFWEAMMKNPLQSQRFISNIMDVLMATEKRASKLKGKGGKFEECAAVCQTILHTIHYISLFLEIRYAAITCTI